MAQRYVVVGRHPVLGKKPGEHVYLDDGHAGRLQRAGHVRADPAPPAEPPAEPAETATRRTAESASPPRRTAKKTKKETNGPRQPPGPSHVSDGPAETPEPESSAESRPQEQDVNRGAGDG